MSVKPLNNKDQKTKFKELAKQLNCNEDENTFDDKLKQIAKAPPPKDDKDKSKDKTPDK